MKDNVPHRWGGLAARYKKNRVAIRFVDPLTGFAHEFGRDEWAERWLQHRFDPSVLTLRVGDDALDREVEGVIHKSKVHLDITYRSGTRVLELVSKRAVSAGIQRKLNALARANGATGVVCYRDDIREDAVLIANLRQLRQNMQQQGSARHDEALLSSIKGGRHGTRGEFLAANPRVDNYIDAFLGFKHCEGVLTLDLKGGRYGNQTRISLSA